MFGKSAFDVFRHVGIMPMDLTAMAYKGKLNLDGAEVTGKSDGKEKCRLAKKRLKSYPALILREV